MRFNVGLESLEEQLRRSLGGKREESERTEKAGKV